MNKKIKITLIVVVCVGVLYAVARMLPKRSSGPTSSITKEAQTLGGVQPTTMMPAAAGNEFASALSSITSISIDTALFQSISYKALRDYPVSLGTDIVGRSNPFAPVGLDESTPVVSDTLSQIQTLQPAKVTSTTAEFGAQVTLASKVPATVVFEYGTTDQFGNASSPVAIKTTGAVVSRTAGLIPATTYYVRAILVQGGVTTTGNTMTFITSANSR